MVTFSLCPSTVYLLVLKLFKPGITYDNLNPHFFFILNHVFYLLLLVSLTLCPGVRILPFFSQIRWGSGTPWATQLNTALPPAVLDTDCGHCRNSGGAEEETEQDRAGGSACEQEKSHRLPIRYYPDKEDTSTSRYMYSAEASKYILKMNPFIRLTT